MVNVRRWAKADFAERTYSPSPLRVLDQLLYFVSCAHPLSLACSQSCSPRTQEERATSHRGRESRDEPKDSHHRSNRESSRKAREAGPTAAGANSPPPPHDKHGGGRLAASPVPKRPAPSPLPAAAKRSGAAPAAAAAVASPGWLFKGAKPPKLPEAAAAAPLAFDDPTFVATPTADVTYRTVQERIEKCGPRERAKLMKASRRIQRWYHRRSTRMRARRIVLNGSAFTSSTGIRPALAAGWLKKTNWFGFHDWRYVVW